MCEMRTLFLLKAGTEENTTFDHIISFMVDALLKLDQY